MDIAAFFRTSPRELDKMIIPDCGHAADHVDLSKGEWTCFHADHRVCGRGGFAIPGFAALEF